ncbi:cytochrome P450 6g1-like [Haematobia irritans]|uniref:cytochrome P450 6g1-like n=1 Tax=Haematobia irritans TaxID=7368 RepID=UPI003F4FC85B
MLLPVICICLIALLALWASWCYRKNFGYWEKRNIPNVPGLFSGCLKDTLTLKTNFAYHLKSIYMEEKFQEEPVVGIYAFHRPALLIRDPDLLKSVFVKNFQNFPNHFARSDPNVDTVGSLSISVLRYNVWKKMHTALTPVFSYGKIKLMYPLIQKVGDNLRKFMQVKGSRFVIDMKHLATLYTTDSFGTAVFGLDSNVLENPKSEFALEIKRMVQFDWKRAITFIFVYFMPQLTGLVGAKMYHKETEKYMASMLSEIMEAREKSAIKRNDLIDVFLKLKDNPELNTKDMPPIMNNIQAQAIFFTMAGFETSATTISSTLLELAKNPHIQLKLRDEIYKAWHEGQGEISYESLNSLEYLDKVVHETLRMYPPLPLLEREHLPTENGELFSLRPYKDYTIPQGMAVYISVYGLHYDPKHWPDPHIFNPERFSVEEKMSRHPMVYLPFGNGPHKCMGTLLGLLQVKVFLVNFLQDHYVRLCEKTPLSAKLEPKSFILQVKGGVPLEVVLDDMNKMDVEGGPIYK